MKSLVAYLQSGISYLFAEKNRKALEEWALYGLFFVLFLSVGLYVLYPDEFVNILAGKAINEGKLPYKEYFDHHLPLAWYMAGIYLKLSFGSYIIFRLLWAATMFMGLFMLARYMRGANPRLYPYFLFFFFLYPLISVYFWLHLYLADSLAVFFFSLSFWLLLTENFRDKPSPTALYISTFLNFCILFSSLTFLYLTAVLYLWQLIILNRTRFSWVRTLCFIGISAVPFVYYALHLVVSGTWYDAYISNFYYNTNLYIRLDNYPADAGFNPFLFMLTILFNFHQDYLPLLTRVRELNIYFPVGMTAALGSFVLLVWLGLRRKIEFVLFLLLVSFSAPRSSIEEISETDYQAGMFLFVGLIAACVVLYLFDCMREEKKKEYALGMVFRGLTFIVGVYLLFTTAFAVKNGYDTFFRIATNFMPRISDVSHPAMFLDEILEQGDTYWIGPYEPHHAFFVTKGSTPGKFPTLLPQFREDALFSDAFIQGFEENPPKVLILKHDASIFNTPVHEFAAFFKDWMKGRYILLEEVDGYEQLRTPLDITIGPDVYIRIDAQEEILKKLEEKGYVRKKD